MKNKDLRDDGEIEKCLKVGEYVKKGMISTYRRRGIRVNGRD
jgi:hypothetical protein